MSFSLCFQTFDGIDIKLLVFLKESDLYFSLHKALQQIFLKVWGNEKTQFIFGKVFSDEI